MFNSNLLHFFHLTYLIHDKLLSEVLQMKLMVVILNLKIMKKSKVKNESTYCTHDEFPTHWHKSLMEVIQLL
jgi:hypothetical protein